MARASVHVPAALVGAVRDTVVRLYHSTVEALHLSLRAHIERGEPRDDATLCRARLADLDALLVRLGWWGGAAADGDVELRAPRDVLHDALYGTLIEAGERLAAACGDGWRVGDCPDTVRGAALEVIALDGLLAELREQ
jgi:hypothetical protein